jgi:hypothetical protein
VVGFYGSGVGEGVRVRIEGAVVGDGGVVVAEDVRDKGEEPEDDVDEGVGEEGAELAERLFLLPCLRAVVVVVFG